MLSENLIEIPVLTVRQITRKRGRAEVITIPYGFFVAIMTMGRFGSRFVMLLALDGSSAEQAAHTCSTLHDDYPNLESGIYWIDPDGDGGTQAYRARCDMDTLGGGWTIVKRWGSGANYSNSLFMSNTNSMGRSASEQGSVEDSTLRYLTRARLRRSERSPTWVGIYATKRSRACHGLCLLGCKP